MLISYVTSFTHDIYFVLSSRRISAETVYVKMSLLVKTRVVVRISQHFVFRARPYPYWDISDDCFSP